MNTLKEIKVTYRNNVKYADRPKIITSKDADIYLRTLWTNDMDFCESFYLLCLNRSNRVIGWRKMSQGGLGGCVVDVQQIIAIALKTNSAGIYISHNHPSGNLKPSPQDIQLTRKIKEAGRFFDIQLLDHAILTSESYYSFADEGMM